MPNAHPLSLADRHSVIAIITAYHRLSSKPVGVADYAVIGLLARRWGTTKQKIYRLVMGK